MASRLIGRAACPECGFASAHVKESEKCTYRYCPECGSQHHAKTERQVADLLAKTRLSEPSPTPTGKAADPAPTPAPLGRAPHPAPTPSPTPTATPPAATPIDPPAPKRRVGLLGLREG